MYNVSAFVNRLFPGIFFITTLLSGSGCTLSRMVKLGAEKQKISVTPSVLEVKGNSVPFEVVAQVPLKLVTKKPSYSIALAYKYGKNETEPLGRLNFVPGDFIYENGIPTIRREMAFNFTPEKASGKLMAQGVASKPGGRSKRTKAVEIAVGVVTTSKLVVKTNAVALSPTNYHADTAAPELMTFYFDQGQAELRDYLGTDVESLLELIEGNYPTQEVEITAGHSPEEEDAKDPKLPLKRAQTIENYYRQQLDVNSYTNVNRNIKFKTIPVRKDWDRFLKQLQLSALSADQINDILSIINSTDSFKQKEKQLSGLDSYEYLQLYIYPTLRYADVKITYTRPQKLDSEIYLLSKKIVENKVQPDALTEEELRYSASLTPLLSEKLEIYKAAVLNTRKWQAYNDLGVTYFEMAQKTHSNNTRNKLLREAITNLTYASHRRPTAATFYNLASAQYQKGDLIAAQRSFDYAIKLGGPVPVLQQVFADKAALEIELGQLDDALTSLAYAGKTYQMYMNKALVYLLKGYHEQGAELYEQALELKPGDPLAHYSLAILGARTGNEEEVMQHLREAIRRDRSLISKAIEDAEFRAYVKLPAFQAAVK